MRIIELINDYWPVLLALGALADVVAGYLPAKFSR